MKFTPEVNVLHSIRNQHNLTWPKLLSELIDNALDARAKTVRIDFSQKNTLEVADDGVGCADLSRMLVIGRRESHASTRTGRYGIGAKDAMIGLGDVVSIRSVHAGVCQGIRVDWRSSIRQQPDGTWEGPDPERMETTAASGTVITINPLRKKRPTDFDGLRQQLAQTYGPALSAGDGFQILLCWRRGHGFESIQPASPPDMDPQSTKTFEVRPNQSARITVGIITRPEDRRLEGVTVTLAGCRVVAFKTRWGLPNHATPGLYGLVELQGRGWSISKNKDELSEHDREAVASLIAVNFGDIIEASRRQSEHVYLRGINGLLRMVSDKVRSERRKARRGSPSNPTGRVEPTGNGGPHTRAARTQPGDRFDVALPDRDGGGLEISPQDRTAGDHLFDLMGRHIIVVNTAHPAFAQVGDLKAIIPPALVWYASRAVIGRWKELLPFTDLDGDVQDQITTTASAYLAAYHATLADEKQGGKGAVA